MKCSRCYQTIPSGEEIQKTSWFGWWGLMAGHETLCISCAKIRDQQKKWFLIIAIGVIVVYLLVVLLMFLGVWSRMNKMFR